MMDQGGPVPAGFDILIQEAGGQHVVDPTRVVGSAA